MRRPLWVVIMAVWTAAAALPGTAAAQLFGPHGAWTVSSSFVPDMARVGNVVYVAGEFSTVAPRAKLISRFSEFTVAGGTLARALPVIGGGDVFAIVDDGAGGWFIGGNFTSVANAAGAFVPRAGLARILANGTLDSSFAPTVGGVNALARVGSTLYVGGSFTTVNGQPRGRGAAFDIGSGALGAWNPGVDNNLVTALAVSASSVFVGGSFTTVAGVGRVGLAAVDLATGALQAFTANLADAPSVFAASLVVSGSTLYVGGSFGSIGGTPRANLAALNATTAAVLPFTANTNSGVATLLHDAGTLYLGGSFTEVAGTARLRAAAVDATSGALTPWHPQVEGESVRALSKSGSTMYLAGLFRSVGGEQRANIAAVSTAGAGAVSSWNPGLSDITYALVAGPSAVTTGGRSLHYGAVARTRLAAFDLISGELLPLSVPINGTVRGITAVGDTLYLAGLFTEVGGVTRNWFAAVNRHTGAVLPWNPNATVALGALSGGRVVLVDGARAFIGGFFGFVGGQPREGLAEVDVTTGAVTAFSAGAVGGVTDLLLTSSTLYVSGSFTQMGGQPRNNIAAFTLPALSLAAFNPNATGGTQPFVNRMRLAGTRLFLAGSFTQIGGSARTNVAAVNAVTGAIDPFAPVVDGTVWDVSVRGTQVNLGGAFTTVNGQTRRALANVDAATGQTTTAFDAQIALGEVRFLAGNAEGLLVGGFNVAAGGFFQNVMYFRSGAVAGPPGPPSAPSIRLFGSALEVRWSAPTIGGTPDDYVVEAGTGPGLANLGTLPTAGIAPFFSFAGVPPGTYYLRVRGRNAAGVGPASPEVAFTAGVPGCTAPPQAPLFTPAVSGVNVTLNWSHAIGNNATYQLRVGTAVGQSNVATVNLGSATSFSAAGAPGAFFGRMLAANPCGQSAPSIDALISIGGVAPPPAPTAAWSVTGNTVAIVWTAVPGAAQYRVEAGAAPLSSAIAVLPVAGTSLGVPGVPSGTYYVRVVALGAAGPSLPSNELAIIVP